MCHVSDMQDNKSVKPVRVSIVALPETTPTALYGLYEVFSSVGVSWHLLTGEGADTALFEVEIVSVDGLPFTGAIGAPVRPHASIGDTGKTDVVFVTDLALGPGDDLRNRWPEMASWIARQYENGSIVCSVCTGALLLAEAGLLDHREATTHWGACELLRAYYPLVDLKPERIMVPVGPEHRIITSGGASSWEDVALYVIARFCGETEAIRTQKVFLFGDRSEGQLPYSAMGRPKIHDDAIVAECQSWVAMHYAESNPVLRMVERSGLAERTFKRRFKSATGYSPMDYVQTLRIEEAKQMLEVGEMATDHIAQAIGYEDPTFFRRLFKKRTGVTPGRYRRRFQVVSRFGRAQM